MVSRNESGRPEVLGIAAVTSYLWAAANILRGPVDAADFKTYIFPLLFFKRFSDVCDEEYVVALEESDGDVEFARFPENHRFQVPESCNWKDVRAKSAKLGHALQKSMRCIEQEAEEGIVRYLSNLYQVQNKDKALFDAIEYESEVEKQFARDQDNNENVRLFVKLPRWFKIDTPIGPYNTDWAFVTERDEKLYFVRETKSTLDSEERRTKENQKILCGRKHFETLEVDFDVVTSLSEVKM